MRRMIPVIAAMALVLGCAPIDENPEADGGEQSDAGGQTDGGTQTDGGDDGASQTPCEAADLPLTSPGTLTVGTSYPYYRPFKSGPRTNPEGFEPDVAAEVAQRLGQDEVAWEIAPFDSLYAPGTKPYDFAMDQISITPEREEVVDFSEPYYRIQQGLLVNEGTPIAEASTIEELQQYRFGAQVGTTGLTYIEQQIQPDEPPSKYNDTNDAAQALAVDQIDAVVIDVPIAIPLTEQFPGTMVAGQFITDEGYGLAFHSAGGELLPCVNEALAAMEQDGTLQQLQNEWLPELDVDIPVIE